MSQPPIEILLATYNGERYLEAQISSILEQSNQDFHILIRDDGSTDATPEILDEFAYAHPEQIRLCPAETNRKGAVKNFSALLEASTADYLMFCDQDDIWLPDKIDITYHKIKDTEILTEAETPILVHTDLRVVDSELHILHTSFLQYARLNPARTAIQQLLIQNVVTGSTVMFNRPLANLAAPIPENARMHDWWLALAASCFGQIVMIDEPTALYRQHAENVLGAKAYNFKYLGRKFGETLQMKTGTILAENYIQAEAFLNRYAPRLNPQEKQILRAFIELQTQPYLQRRLTLLKYGFTKGRFAQNLGLFLKI